MLRRHWPLVLLAAFWAVGALMPFSAACRDMSQQRADDSPQTDEVIATRDYVATTFEVPRAGRQAVLVDHRGRVVVAVPMGDSLILRRYSRAGPLDDSFGAAGRSSLSAGRPGVTGVFEQSNGRLIIVGSELMRHRTAESVKFFEAVTVTAIRPDGRADAAFGMNGRVVSTCGRRATAGVSPLAATVAPDDSVYVLCSSPPLMSVLRILEDGSPDPAHADGVVMSTEASAQINGSISLLLDGTLVVALQNESELTIVRSTPGPPSIETFPRHGDCAPRPIILRGGDVETVRCGRQSASVFRYGARTEPRAAVVATLELPRGAHVAAMFRDPRDRITLAGSLEHETEYELFIARYGSDGQPDRTFHNDGVLAFREGGFGGISIIGNEGTLVASWMSVRSDSADRVVLVWSSSQ